MIKIAIFASGNGSNFEVLAKKILQNKLPNAKLIFLFSNKKNAFVLERAKKINVKTYSFSPKQYKNPKEYNLAILNLLIKNKIDYVILSGYMLVLDKEIIDKYNNKIINIHPSYLPNFKGLDVIRKAYNSNEKYTGISIHYVNEKIDDGEIILQKKILINRKKGLDFLEKKIHKLEHKFFFKAIKKAIEYENKN